MRRIINFAMGMLMFVLVGASAGLAQSVPPGSYQQTCRDIGVRGDVLTARCKDTGGNWQNAQMRDISYCNGDITNEDGRLRCAGSGYGYGGRRDDDDHDRGYGGGYQGNSSYTQTCRDVRQHGDTLEAVCQSRDGDWHRTTLNDYRDCRGQIVNDGGNLRCDNSNYNNVGGWQGGFRGRLPGGSYTQTCQNIRVSGDELVASCQKRDGGWRNTKLDDYQTCRADITNDNGRLRCGR